MPRPKSPMLATVEFLTVLKKFPDGATTRQLSEALGRRCDNHVSKLYAYGVIDRRKSVETDWLNRKRWLYFTKLPRAPAPATVPTYADVVTDAGVRAAERVES